MNKNKALKIAMIICAAVLVAAVALAAGGLFGLSRYTYDRADKYTAGAAEITGNVKNLDADWLNGRITVAYHAEPTVLLQETANRDIPEELALRWWLDGDTLRIRFAKDGARTGGFLFFGKPLEKSLTLTLPEGLALTDAKLHVTSGEVSVPEMTADTAAFTATSGRIDAAVNAREIRMHLTSGDGILRTGDTAALSADVTSGSLWIAAGAVDSLKAKATSGNITVEAAETKDTAVSVTSGIIRFTAGAIGAADLSATSGDVQVFLPAEPGFTARVHTTSGRFEYGLPLTASGDTYVCGDGSASVKINVTSGNIRLDPLP